MSYTLIVLLVALATHATVAQWDASGRVPLHGYRDSLFRPVSSEKHNRMLAVDRLDRILTIVFKKDSPGSLPDMVIERFHATGVRDSSFGSNGSLVMRVDPALNMVLMGFFVDDNNDMIVVSKGEGQVLIAKLRENTGLVDSSYAVNGRRIISSDEFEISCWPYWSGGKIFMSCSYSDGAQIDNRLLTIDGNGNASQDTLSLPDQLGILVPHDGAYFIGRERSITKWKPTAVRDSSFGLTGLIQWSAMTGGGGMDAMVLLDDTTLVTVGYELERGPAIDDGETFVIYIDTRDAMVRKWHQRDVDVASPPAEESMTLLSVGEDKSVTVGGFHRYGSFSSGIPSYKSAPYFLRYNASGEPDSTFFSSGEYLLQPSLPDTSTSLWDMALLSNNDVVYIESSRMLGRLRVMPTDVHDDTDDRIVAASTIYASPNPTTGMIHLHSTLPLHAATYVLYSLTGDAMQAGNLDTSATVILDGSCAPGVYLMRIHTSNGDIHTISICVL